MDLFGKKVDYKVEVAVEDARDKIRFSGFIHQKSEKALRMQCTNINGEKALTRSGWI